MSSDTVTPANSANDGQQRLVEPEEVEPETKNDTVWVVAAQHCDDPHPIVIGAYSSEEAANERKKEEFGSWPICAIGVYEQEVDDGV